MAVDTLEVAQNVEVERGGLDALDLTVPKAANVIGCRSFLEMTDVNLRLDQLAGKLLVTRNEDALRDPEILYRDPIELLDLRGTFGREREVVLGLLPVFRTRG